MKKASRHTYDERQEHLNNLEKDLASIDKFRAEKIDVVVLEYNKQVRKLKFLPPEIVTRMIQVQSCGILL